MFRTPEWGWQINERGKEKMTKGAQEQEGPWDLQEVNRS